MHNWSLVRLHHHTRAAHHLAALSLRLPDFFLPSLLASHLASLLQVSSMTECLRYNDCFPACNSTSDLSPWASYQVLDGCQGAQSYFTLGHEFHCATVVLTTHDNRLLSGPAVSWTWGPIDLILGSVDTRRRNIEATQSKTLEKNL